jgi:predicted Zn-dependent protease
LHKWRRRWRKFTVFTIVTFLSVFVFINTSVRSQPDDDSNLPPAKVHPLPKFLLKRQDWLNQGDYFDQVKATPLGYLVWSKFPVQVFVEESESRENSSANQRFQAWTAKVRQAIAEWNIYFPLQETPDRDMADIVILRSLPKRTIKLNPDTGLYDIPRAIAAQTNYEFYLTTEGGEPVTKDPAVIAMRMMMQISPNFTGVSLLATVRHELGHALGIWGHSPESGDALYFSQVSNPPAISPRDINTLKKIYQQPTRLGWTDY